MDTRLTLIMLDVASRQSFAGSFTFHTHFQVCLLGCVLVVVLLLVGGQIAPEIVDGFLASRCFLPAGWTVLRSLFLPMCLSVSYQIHDNPGKNMVHKFSPRSCYPAFTPLIPVCVG